MNTFYKYIFINVDPTNVRYLFDHLLKSTFQLVVTHYELLNNIIKICYICKICDFVLISWHAVYIERVRLKHTHKNTPSKYPTLRSHRKPPLKRSSCLKEQKLGFSLRREK